MDGKQISKAWQEWRDSPDGRKRVDELSDLLTSARAIVAAEVARERERCAKVCENMRPNAPFEPDDVERGFRAALSRAAAAIRQGE